jgi:hypothetical protein
MRTFADNQKQTRNLVVSGLGRPKPEVTKRYHSEEFDVDSISPRLDYNFGQLLIHPPREAIDKKTTIGQPGDQYEQKADRISQQVIRNQPPQGILQSARSDHLKQSAMPSVVREAVSSPGQPLGSLARGFMEARFRHDFSKVRIHTGPKAADSAQAIGAAAYTVGNDIVFGPGGFAPETHDGRQLIAHELTHVLQQSGTDSNLGIQRQPQGAEARGGPGPVTRETGDVSVYVGKTVTAEAALREIYRQGARQISEEALRMVAKGTSVEDAARWASQARNELKVLIRAEGSPIIRGFAEARNVRKYGNKVGPSYEELIREGKTPEDIIGSAGRASTKLNRVATTLKVGGYFLIAVDIAIVTWEVFEAPEGERLRTAVTGGGRIAGGLAGGWAGAKGGAAVGGFFGGPIGAGIGGVIGGIGGVLVGGWLGGKVAEKTYDLVDDLVNPRPGSVWDLQKIVIDGIEEQYIREHARQVP